MAMGLVEGLLKSAMNLKDVQLEKKMEMMREVNNLFIANRKASVVWVAKHFKEFSNYYRTPWLQRLMDEVLLNATWK